MSGRVIRQSISTAGFQYLRSLFNLWGDLAEEIREIVVGNIQRALPLTTPAYNFGATENFRDIGCMALLDSSGS